MSRLLLAATAGAGLAVALVLRFAKTLRAPVFSDAANADASVSLLVSLPDPLGLSLAAAAGAGVGVVLHRAGRGSILTPFLVPGLALLVYVPGVFRWAPMLAAFHGPFLDAVLLAASGVALWRLVRSGRGATGLAFPCPSPRWVALIAACLYLALGLRLMRDVGLSGDEPHYLLIAESVIRDGDLRVANNYLGEHYTRFYQGKIGPHLAAGTPYSVHGVGLPLLLLPGFALGGLVGVVVTEAILSGLLLAGLYRAASNVAGRREALLAAVGFGWTAPALFLAVMAYPELPAALVVVLVFLALSDGTSPSRWRAFGTGVAIGLLPFLHVKFSPLAALLVALVVLHWRRTGTGSSGASLACGVGAASMALAWLALLAATLGTLDPTASYGRPRLFLESLPLGVAGLLFDQEFGLLPVSPFYVLGIPGLAVLARREGFLGWAAVAIVAAVLLPGAAHPLWTGGNSPPARFLLPALPVLAIAAAALVRDGEGRVGLSRWTASLTATSLAIAGAMVLLPGQPLYLNARNGRGRIWEALSSGWDVTAYLPSLVTADSRSLALASVAGVSLAAALVFHSGHSGHSGHAGHTGTRARGLRLPPFAAVALLGALALDVAGGTARRALEGRWVTAAWGRVHDLRERRFALLPSPRTFAVEPALSRLTLPLAPLPRDGDPRHWWSLRYRIPAGDYAAHGVAPRGAALCNGASCFGTERVSFRTRVGLASFRLRAQRLTHPPTLRLLDTRPTSAWALRSVPFSRRSDSGGNERLHALDDGAYLDPRGFWVKAGESARFALESERTCAEGCVLELSNGGRPNWVEVRAPAGTGTRAGPVRFPMAPWEQKSYRVVARSEVVEVVISSERGFRPAELDASSDDGRALGVLVRMPPFDLSP